MTITEQPKALQLAEYLEKFRSFPEDIAAAAELRSQHARIAELEAQLSAIGAGGVEPLRKRAPAPQEVHPESIREGAPYDNPEFEQLARDMGVWGTAQSAVCAQFWLAATQPAAQRSAYAAKGAKEVFCKKCEMTVISNCGSASGCPVRNIYAAQAKHGGAA